MKNEANVLSGETDLRLKRYLDGLGSLMFSDSFRPIRKSHLLKCAALPLSTALL